MNTEVFTKHNLTVDRKWIHYTSPDGERKFVARFRVAGAKGFATHLRKHHTPAEYFSAMENGETPLEIAKKTGYMLPHIKRWLRQAGYPVTEAGYIAWQADQYMPTVIEEFRTVGR